MKSILLLIILCLFSTAGYSIGEGECKKNLAKASGLHEREFEETCANEKQRKDSTEYAKCLSLFKDQELQGWDYLAFCRDGKKDTRHAIHTCLVQAYAIKGLGRLNNIDRREGLALCQEDPLPEKFNEIVKCVVDGSAMFAEKQMWELKEVCQKGGLESVKKVKNCTATVLAKVLEIIPEAKHQMEGELPLNERGTFLNDCSKPDTYNNLSAVLACQTRVGQSVRKLLDKKADTYDAARGKEASDYAYENAKRDGLSALGPCLTNQALQQAPSEVMDCVDQVAAISNASIFDSYEGNKGFLAVSIQGSHFYLHIERCATEELRQFQNEVRTCVTSAQRLVPKDDQAMVGGSFIWCEMFTAANRGLASRAPVVSSKTCP